MTRWRRTVALAAAGAAFVASAPALGSTTPICARNPVAEGRGALAVAVGNRDAPPTGLISLLAFTDTFNYVTLDPKNGRTLAREKVADRLVSRDFGYRVSTTQRPLAQRLVVQEQAKGCHALSRRISDARTGAVVRSETLKASLEPAGDTWLNVVAPPLADLNRDGYPDNTVEVRSGPDDTSLHEYEPWEGRDVTSGLRRRGWAGVMDGRTGRLIEAQRQDLTLGPGPLSTFFGTPGHIGWAALTNTDVRTRVNAFGRVGTRTWRRSLDVFPYPLQTLSLPSGPVFVTMAGLEAGAVAAPGGVGSIRITALDGSTGRTSWQRDYPNAYGIIRVFALQGDVLVHHDSKAGSIERLDGRTGTEKWRHTYVDRALFDPQDPREFNGDGVPDLLERDDTTGVSIIDGNDGTTRPIPALDAFTSHFPAHDLDGDGADDFAAVLGTYLIVAVPARAATGIQAISGRTGLPLWTAPMVPSSDNVDIVSASFDRGKPADIIVHRDATDLTRLDGRDGHVVWTRAAP